MTAAQPRVLRIGWSALVAALAAGWLLVGCAGSSGWRRSITLYSGQHVQTTEALVSAFEKADRDHGQPAQRRRGHAGRPDRHRGVALAGRRVLHRELPAARVPPGQGPAGRGRSRRPWPTRRRRFNSPDGRLGRRLGPGQRDRLQHRRCSADGQLPTVDHGPGRPAVEGQAGPRRRARPTSSPSSPPSRRTYGEAGGARLARGGSRPTPAATSTRTTRRSPRGQQRRRSAFGVVNQYYWYRLKAEVGAGGMHSAIAYFAPHDPGYVLDVSGAGVLRSSHPPGRGPALPRLPHLAAGTGDHRPQRQLRVPDRLGRHDRPAARPPSTELQPNPITVAELGDRRRGDHAVAAGAAAVSGPSRSPLSASTPAGIRRAGGAGPVPRPARAPSCALSPSSLLLAAGVPGRPGVAGRLGRAAPAAVPPLTASCSWNTVGLAVVVTALCAVIGTLGAPGSSSAPTSPARRLLAIAGGDPARHPRLRGQLRVGAVFPASAASGVPCWS